MRTRFLVPAALLVVACQRDPLLGPAVDVQNKPPVTITLRVGQRTAVNNVSLLFAGVPEDSRCPVDVTCVWAGNAKVELGIGPFVGTRGMTVPVELNTTGGPHAGEAWGLRVVLVALRPDPVSTERIGPDDYVVELRVGGVNAPSSP